MYSFLYSLLYESAPRDDSDMFIFLEFRSGCLSSPYQKYPGVCSSSSVYTFFNEVFMVTPPPPPPPPPTPPPNPPPTQPPPPTPHPHPPPINQYFFLVHHVNYGCMCCAKGMAQTGIESNAWVRVIQNHWKKWGGWGVGLSGSGVGWGGGVGVGGWGLGVYVCVCVCLGGGGGGGVGVLVWNAACVQFGNGCYCVTRIGVEVTSAILLIT